MGLSHRAFGGVRDTFRMAGPATDRITKTPGVCGGRACVAGHRVRVMDIAIWSEHEGMTPDEIVAQAPSLTLGDVHAALAYYFDRIEEIQEEIRAEKELGEAARRGQISLVDEKLRRERIDKPA